MHCREYASWLLLTVGLACCHPVRLLAQKPPWTNNNNTVQNSLSNAVTIKTASRAIIDTSYKLAVVNKAIAEIKANSVTTSTKLGDLQGIVTKLTRDLNDILAPAYSLSVRQFWGQGRPITGSGLVVSNLSYLDLSYQHEEGGVSGDSIGLRIAPETKFAGEFNEAIEDLNIFLLEAQIAIDTTANFDSIYDELEINKVQWQDVPFYDIKKNLEGLFNNLDDDYLEPLLEDGYLDPLSVVPFSVLIQQLSAAHKDLKEAEKASKEAYTAYADLIKTLPQAHDRHQDAIFSLTGALTADYTSLNVGHNSDVGVSFSWLRPLGRSTEHNTPPGLLLLASSEFSEYVIGGKMIGGKMIAECKMAVGREGLAIALQDKVLNYHLDPECQDSSRWRYQLGLDIGFKTFFDTDNSYGIFFNYRAPGRQWEPGLVWGWDNSRKEFAGLRVTYHFGDRHDTKVAETQNQEVGK